MKLIFLDVDGVLNYENCSASVNGYYGVEPEKVSLLKKIVEKTGAKIVLTSTWRREIKRGAPLEAQDNPFAIELMSKLAAEGLKIYDYTPADNDDYERADQIERLMKEYRHNGQQIDSFVVLDDVVFPDFVTLFDDHLVITDYETGLTEGDVDVAVEILGGK